MNKLILVEGIPGSGKSTFAQKIGEHLSANGIKTNVYTEGQLQPADLAWCACIPIEHFNDFIKSYPRYEAAIKKNMYIEDGYVIIAYLQFPIEDPELYRLLESYEVYNNKAGFDVFSSLHLRRWKRFSIQAEKSDEITVFECVYLQNQLGELVYYHDMDENNIENYMVTLINTVKNLDPIMFYIAQPNIPDHIQQLCEQRVNANGEKEWLAAVRNYIENSPYGRKNNLKEYDGVIKCFEARQKTELNLIKKLPITAHIIYNQNYDWDDIWDQIKQKLNYYTKQRNSQE